MVHDDTETECFILNLVTYSFFMLVRTDFFLNVGTHIDNVYTDIAFIIYCKNSTYRKYTIFMFYHRVLQIPCSVFKQIYIFDLWRFAYNHMLWSHEPRNKCWNNLKGCLIKCLNTHKLQIRSIKQHWLITLRKPYNNFRWNNLITVIETCLMVISGHVLHLPLMAII